MDVSLIYLMISTPVTETYMVVKHAKRVIYMSHMEGLTLDKTAWKYTEQICGTQFQNMLKCQSLYTYSNKDCVIFYKIETTSIRMGRRHDGCSKTTNWWEQSSRRHSVPTSMLKINKQWIFYVYIYGNMTVVEKVCIDGCM